MFELDAVSIADHRAQRRRAAGSARSSPPSAWCSWSSAPARPAGPRRSRFAVGGYIAAAYWFTSSTSFANPAVTVARMFSDTFAGIAPGSVPMFVLMQLVGGALGARASSVVLLPAVTQEVVPHDHAHRPLRLRPQRRPLPDGRRLPAAPRRRPGRGALRRLRSPPTRSTRSPSRRWPRRASTSPREQPQGARPTDAVQESDVVVTMGCGDACPFFPGKRYEDWVLDDPAGQDIEAVRPIRDEIRRASRSSWPSSSVDAAGRLRHSPA